MRTAQVARQAGVNTQTLRYYERRGLLPDPGRTDAGYRIYGPDSCDTTRRLATEKITELDAKIASLQAMRASLARLTDTCTRPRADRDCPLLHTLDPGQDTRP
jgi:DNA-binding transcriptional MerR regulator